MKKVPFIILVVLLVNTIHAQNVGIGTTSPHVSAILDITANNRGLLIPRVALTDLNDAVTIPSPAASLLVYNTATAGSGRFAVSPGYYYWNAVSLAWIPFALADNSLKASWLLGGNIATSTINNFIGTTDNQSLLFKINNANAGYLGTAGNTYWGLNSGNINSSGVSNVAIGNYALFQNTNRSNLVAVGDSALLNNGTGASTATQAVKNTAIGSKALYKNNVGSYNTAVGYNALLENTGGTQNTATGVDVLHFNTTGLLNTGTGINTLFLNTAGSFNAAAGANSLVNNTTGNNNTSNGYNALFSNSTGYSNVAVGSHALRLNTYGYNLVAVGDSALFSNTNGQGNTAIGSKALFSNLSGHSNTAHGFQSLYSNTASGNTATGYRALYANSTGYENTAFGLNTLMSNTEGILNTGFGSHSLISNTTGDYNTAFGFQSLASNNGSRNTAYGTSTLVLNGTGDDNTAMGFNALFYNSTGYNNVAVGTRALYTNTGGIHSVAVGYAALANSTGSKNVAMGYHSLFGNTTGVGNTAIGDESLQINTTGGQNTAIGYGATVSESGKTNATAIGAFARADCSNCMVLGSVEDVNGASSNVNVGIGTNIPQAKLQVATGGLPGSILLGANKYSGGYTNLEMGISAASNGYSYIQSTQASGSSWGGLALNPAGGNVGLGINTALATLHIKQRTETYPVNGGGLRLERATNANHWEIGTDFGNDLDLAFNGVIKGYFRETDGVYVDVSDIRMKKDIENIEQVLPVLMLLQAKTYRYKDNVAGARLSYGFIAQDVEKLFPAFVDTKGTDGLKAIAYQNFSVVTIKAIQEQQVIIESLQKQAEAAKAGNSIESEKQQTEIDSLKAQVKAILAELDNLKK
ncbi:MAG: tail fiber domain-containing protein [Bacteroidota bacterium]